MTVWWYDGMTVWLYDGMTVRWYDGMTVRWYDGMTAWDSRYHGGSQVSVLCQRKPSQLPHSSELHSDPCSELSCETERGGGGGREGRRDVKDRSSVHSLSPHTAWVLTLLAVAVAASSWPSPLFSPVPATMEAPMASTSCSGVIGPTGMCLRPRQIWCRETCDVM